MSNIYVDPMDTDSTGDLFSHQDLELWLDPDSWDSGLGPTDTPDINAEFAYILGEWPLDPPETQVSKPKIHLTWAYLQAVYDKILKLRGKLWNMMNTTHQNMVKAVIKELLDAHSGGQ